MYYNRNPKLTKSGDIIRDLNEVIGIKEDTIENIFEKEEKIGIIAIKGERFKMQSMGSFDLVYKEVEQKYKKRKKQIIICVIIVILIIFILICLN
jgi:t-SNARE complex subunit (syntaxin)